MIPDEHSWPLEELCIEITKACPLRCTFCSTFNDRDRKVSTQHLPGGKIKLVLNEFHQLGGKILEISGGEPLLHPELLDIIEHAKNLDLQVYLYTSGWTQNPLDSRIEELTKAGLDRLIINCQGPEDTHDSLTNVKGSFNNAINLLKSAKEAGLWTGVHFIPMKPNIPKLRDLLRTLSKLEVNEAALLRLVKQGRASTNWESLKPKGLDYIQLTKTIRALSEGIPPTSKFTIRLGCPFSPLKTKGGLNSDRDTHCHAGKNSLNITPEGNVLPCPAFKDIRGARIGNIFTEPLEKIWKSNKFLLTLRNLDVIETCRSCKLWNQCRGGCAAQRLLEHGTLQKGPDPLCREIPDLLQSPKSRS